MNRTECKTPGIILVTKVAGERDYVGREMVVGDHQSRRNGLLNDEKRQYGRNESEAIGATAERQTKPWLVISGSGRR